MEKFRLTTILESLSINENLPPGAANDSRAPYNQPSTSQEKAEFDAEIEDEDEVKHKVHVTYWYTEPEDSIKKHITDYKHSFVGGKPEIDDDYIDEAVRDLIIGDIGDKYYEFTMD